MTECNKIASIRLRELICLRDRLIKRLRARDVEVEGDESLQELIDKIISIGVMMVYSDKPPAESDTGHDIGTLWLDEKNTRAYILMAVTDGKANWEVFLKAKDLKDESDRAKQAEEFLGIRITTEATRAKEAELLLFAIISTEMERATQMDATLGTRIDNEKTRAMQAELGLDGKIATEKTRAMQAELGLDGKIATEKTRAMQAEAGLDGRLNTMQGEISRIDNLGHFAGAYDTYAALPKNTSSFPQGITVNDFSEIRTDETQGGATTRYIVKAVDEGGIIEWEFSTKLSTDVTGKMDLVAGGKTNNFMSITPEGNSKDSGYSGLDIEEAKDLASEAKDKADEAKEALERAVMSPDGSTKNVVELSQAEYDALPLKDDNTIYIVTDADTPSTDLEQRLIDVEVMVRDNTSEVEKAIKSNNGSVKNFIELTKKQFDLIQNKDPNTIYVVSDINEDDGLATRVTKLEELVAQILQNGGGQI